MPKVLLLAVLILAGCTVNVNWREYHVHGESSTSMKIDLEVAAEHSDSVKQDTSPSTAVDAQVPLIGR